MSRWICVVLIVVLAVSTVFFAYRWQTAASGTGQDRFSHGILEQENSRLQGVLDSLMAAISPGGRPELNAGFWYTQARRARENQRMLLQDDQIQELQDMGLDDPVEPPRDCRRLHFVRGWSHGTKKTVFTRGTRSGGSDGIRALFGVLESVGSDKVHSPQDWLFP
jgi:hypothetical protein